MIQSCDPVLERAAILTGAIRIIVLLAAAVDSHDLPLEMSGAI